MLHRCGVYLLLSFFRDLNWLILKMLPVKQFMFSGIEFSPEPGCVLWGFPVLFYSSPMSIFAVNCINMASKTDVFQSPDYYLIDELLSDEHKLIRETVRSYVKKEISPIIEDFAQKASFPEHIVKQMGELGCFGPTIPEEYGGGGLDYISYGS